MADVTTHLLFGVSAALIVCRNRTREEAMLLILGSVAVDSERPLSLLLNYLGYNHDFTAAFHSLLGIVVISYAAATAFHIEHTDFASRFKLILSGTIVHLLLDLTMHPWLERGLYLYPLKVPYSFGLVWSDFPYFPLFGLLALAIALVIRTILNRFDSL
ncbi:MAG: metal-dependent hydrolase [Promethearchaeia archaeon]